MVKALIYTFFLFTFTTALAQKDYFDGYVILNNTDTIYGKIKDRKSGSFGFLYEKIKFKPPQGRSKKYSPNDILEYKCGESLFVSMWFKVNDGILNPSAESDSNLGKKQFLKLVVKGYLSYYHVEYYNEDSNLDYTPYFKRASETQMVFVRSGIFGLNKKQLVTYFKDCPELQNYILDKAFKSPYEVIAFYNDWHPKK